ncbi:MAG: cytochrome C, partial [Boseongicola sp.]|nr:cytochrome C [Boseongicola sp.]
MDIAVSPSDQIATASFDNSVGAWGNGGPDWLDGHEAAVTTVQFLDDKTIVSGSDDFALRVWALGEGARSEVIGQHQAKITSVAVDPEGQKVATASWDATIGLWSIDPASGGSSVFLEGHRQGVNDIV